MKLNRFPKGSYFTCLRFLIVATCVLIIIIVNLKYVGLSLSSSSHNCLADPPNCRKFLGVQLLPVENMKPSTQSILFLEDHSHDFISPRVLCAVESAALTNPESSVYLLTTSPKVYRTPALLSVLAKNDNIHFGYFDPATLFLNTPLSQWYKNRRWEDSTWPTYHFSDAIRWLMLWLCGGIYMDTDVILMRKLPNSSFVALESKTNLGAGAIGLPAKHELLTTCINEIANYYNPRVWGSAGPELLTKSLQNRCGKNFLSWPSNKCKNITVLGSQSFYPIYWKNWREYFEEKERNDLFNNKDIYGLHVWNALSKNELVNLTKATPYALAARKFCPTVVKSVHDKM